MLCENTEMISVTVDHANCRTKFIHVFAFILQLLYDICHLALFSESSAVLHKAYVNVHSSYGISKKTNGRVVTHTFYSVLHFLLQSYCKTQVVHLNCLLKILAINNRNIDIFYIFLVFSKKE